MNETPSPQMPKLANEPTLIGSMGVLLLIVLSLLINWGAALLFVVYKLAAGDMMQWMSILWLSLSILILPGLYLLFSIWYAKNQIIWSAYLSFVRKPLFSLIISVADKTSKIPIRNERLNNFVEQVKTQSQKLIGLVPGFAREDILGFFMGGFTAAALSAWVPETDQEQAMSKERFAEFVFARMDLKLAEHYRPDLTFMYWLPPINILVFLGMFFL